ncbi:hypothetical protein GBSOP10_106221 [Armatimonadetes bacterium GBS]|jgi:hypothetical protein|nr:MAG: hypothetical protein KatS3mg021_0572 [Fimbriimonadales bacterium]CUU09933.1 hypothetical protein GBSOP10_106221 [Armatimonadetes bacterium GBS]CUU36817.1 hypothetical protein GXSOP10_12921 [Armatimonadetes bacterium GXS]
MGQFGDVWGYYPQDSDGLAVQSALAEPCACPVFAPTQVAVCSPLVDGGCAGERCEEVNSAIFLIAFGVCIPQIQLPPWVIDLASCLSRCDELYQRCLRNALNDYNTAKQRCQAGKSACERNCLIRFPGKDINYEICMKDCAAAYDQCLADASQAYADAVRACDNALDTCRTQCYDRFAPKPAPPKKDTESARR